MSLFHNHVVQDDYDAKAKASMDNDDLRASKAFVVWLAISAALWVVGISVTVS